MGSPKRVDANQREIIDALVVAGCSVVDLSVLGRGAPDLLVGISNRTYLIEVKNPETGGKLNKRQRKWHNDWKGQVAIVYYPQEALEVIKDATN